MSVGKHAPPIGRRQLRARNALGLLATLATVALVGAWFVFLRPVSLGGSTGYVVVSGHSMEPALVTGDLAVLRAAPPYAVGDIIAFTTNGGVVIHRIVGGDATAGYDVQGDSRDLPDLWHPRRAEILGKVWFHVPAFGNAVALLRQPAYLGALAAAAAFFVAFGWGQPNRRPVGRAVPFADRATTQRD